jgi:peptidoglycan/LPS O-acetylase OafA/YrhL
MKAARAARNIPALTGIRAIAALLVLCIHVDQNVPTSIVTYLPFIARGYLGVDFFFVLSGFIITHVYLASFQKLNGGALRIFLWHRFIRLYPVHVTMLLAMIAMVLIAKASGRDFSEAYFKTSDLVWQFLMLHAWGFADVASWNVPSWSISAEWFAYLLFPLMTPGLFALRSRTAAAALAVASLAVMTAIFIVLKWDLNSFVGAPALLRVTGEFVCGAALCRLVTIEGVSRRWSGDLVGAIALAAFLVAASAGVSDFILVALLAITIFGTAVANGFLANFLGSRVGVWLGETSFSIYMIHFPILIVLRRIYEKLGYANWPAAGHATAFVLAFAIVIAAAALLYYAVERPMRTRLRDRMGVFAVPSAAAA